MVIALGMCAGFVIATGYAQERRYAIKGVVVDHAGAVIPEAEVEFKRESSTVVSHTGVDGIVNVDLGAGKYVVTVRMRGFATAKVVDFSVPGSAADTFRVILEVDPTPSGSPFPAGVPLPDTAVPTVSDDEFPDVIKYEPVPNFSPAAGPAVSRRRSVRCLYLWRCSSS
jgi:hypothetical protein